MCNEGSWSGRRDLLGIRTYCRFYKRDVAVVVLPVAIDGIFSLNTIYMYLMRNILHLSLIHI